MLPELISYLTTPCPRYARKLGYLKEIIAIQARFQRVQPAWLPHTQHTKQFILRIAKQCQQSRKVLVLGSGVLADIPIKQLAKQFEQVILLDLAHLRSVRRQVKKYPNVHLQICDILDFQASLLNCRLDNQADLQTLMPSFPTLPIDTDLVISANILSQLPVLPRNYIEKRAPHLIPHLDGWCRTIIQQHVHYLSQLPCRSCLITDTKHTLVNHQYEIQYEMDMLYGTELPNPQRHWSWQIAPQGEMSNNQMLHTRVVAYSLTKM